MIANSYGTLRCTLSLPISDHNIEAALVKLLGHFAQNRRLRAPAKPPVDRGRPVTDPQLRQEVATAVGRQLRENHPGDSRVDDVEAAFTAAIMRTAELVIHPRNEGNRGEVGVETPERKLNCRLRLMRCVQRDSASKWTRGMRSCGGLSGRHVTG